MRRTTSATLAAALTVAGAWLHASPATAATATLQRLAPGLAAYTARPLTFSVAGDVTASAGFVDVQIPPPPTPNSSTSGCEAADFGGFAAGRIALVQRGTCSFAVKAANAQAAGATAVVIFNEGQPGRTELFPASLGAPGVTIPVVVTTFAVAQELFFIGPGLTLRVTVVSDGATCALPPPVGTPVPGKNVIVAQPGLTTIGTDGPDVIYGTSGPDTVFAMGGDDLVFGFEGQDQLAGGDGADTLCGGADRDFLSGGAGNDLLSGDDGDDDLSGGAGDDALLGGAGTNRAVGGDGTDTCNPSGTASSQSATCETADTLL